MPLCTKFSTLSILLLPLLITVSAQAQQTGTAVSATPGSAIGTRVQSVQVPPPKPTCDSPGTTPAPNSTPILPDLLFSREGLICVRHSDGKSEQLADGLPWGFASASKSEIAYWNPDSHELRVKSINGASDHPSDHPSDQLIDTLPGAIMSGMVWSSKGRTLTYFPSRAKPPGLRAINLDSGSRKIFTDNFVSLLASPDPGYVAAVATEGVVRFRLSDGARELVAPATYPAEASYSQSGALLGILVSAPGRIETASVPAAPATNSNSPKAATASPAPAAPPAAPPADDDTPDCTGGSFALIVHRASTGKLVTIPMPKEYDSVLDFAFSADDRSIAVTFGVTGCDYPGDTARIYRVDLSDLALTPISPADRLSVQAHWSPDGNTILYTDYTGSDSPLVAIDLRSHKITRLTNPGTLGPDTFLSWR